MVGLGAAKWKRAEVFLVAMFCVAVAIRLVYVRQRVILPDWDSAPYLVLAENLAEGHGFRDWPGGPPHTWFQPGYPMLIALLGPFVGGFERAGYLIAALFGSLIIVPLYALARRLFSPRVACITAILAIFNYRMVDASSSVITEMPYTFFWLIGLYAAHRIVERDGPPLRLGAMYGAALGVSALIRTEGALYFFFVTLLLGVVVLHRARRDRARLAEGALQLGAAVCLFALVLAPYVQYLHASLGYFTITGRSAHTVFAVIDAPQEIYEFHATSPFAFVAAHPLESIKRVLHNLEFIVRQHAIWAFPPVLIALIATSFFGRPWTRERVAREGFLIALFVFPWLTFYGVTGILTRYYYSSITLGLMWVAGGIDNLYAWFTASRAAIGGDPPAPTPYWKVAAVGLGVAFLASAQQLAWPLRVGHFPIHSQQQKDYAAGTWIKEQEGEGSPMIMCASPRISYYARGKYFGENNPSLDEAGLRGFLEENHIEYLVVDNFFTKQWYPKLAFLADERRAPGYLTFVHKTVYTYEDGAEGYANIYRVAASSDATP